MSRFDEQLARMQGLMNYGVVSEDKARVSSDIEHQAIGADGKSYAIIKENSKYIIKSTDADKANLVESYEYIDGWNHISKHSYDSYSEASKQFDMKMHSLNEAYSKEIAKNNVDSFVPQEYSTESGKEMISEIARMRQITHNAAVIMNEASEISMNNTGDPERESGNSGDKDAPFTDKAEATLDKDPKQASGKPESMGEPYGDDKKAPEGKDAKGPDGCVACQHPSGGKVTRVNEDTMPSGEITDEGLPAEPGTGSPDGHLMEDDEELLNDSDVDSEEAVDDSDEENDIISDDDLEGEGDVEDIEGDDLDDEDLEGEDLEDEDGLDDEDDIDSLRAEIEELQARLDALEGNDEAHVADEEGSLEDDADFDEDIEGDEGVEEPDFEGDEISDEEGEFDPEDMIESIVKNVSGKMIAENKKKAYMESIVNSVVGTILNEDNSRRNRKAVKEERTELHDFGKHPGYRKKPMQLPDTGSDEFHGNRDWNDDSVHSEQPFGQGKGDSKPYKDVQMIVDSITEEVMQAIKKKA